MESTRSTWNDERMDEFTERTEQNFREVRVEIAGARTELRSEIKAETGGLRTEMNERFDRIERRFDILYGAMATGLVGAVVAHFLG